MNLTANLHVHQFSSQNDKGGMLFHAVAAVRLASVPSIRLRGINSHNAELSMLSRQIDLINTLHYPEAYVSYAIRYISKPHPTSFSGGKIEICIFCKANANTAGTAQKRCAEFTEQLIIQLFGSYPDYIWRVVTDPKVFQFLWQPFLWESANILEIRRREELVALDSIRSTRGLGFKPSKPPPPSDSSPSVYFVHSFLPHPNQLERLLRIMLLSKSPVALTLSLNPTRLLPKEEEAYVVEISQSEGYQPSPPPSLQRIQDQRAHMLCQEMVDQLLRLQDAPFQVTVSLASPEKITPSLAGSAGVAISASIGEGPNPLYTESSFIQKGGYDLVSPATEEEMQIARRNAALLNQEPWGKSLASKSLDRVRFLMDGFEAANAFRFPEDYGDGLPGIQMHNQRIKSLPSDMIEKAITAGIYLGTNNYLGIPQEVILPEKDRSTHMYVVGQTGTGKSTLLKSMILSDINAGRGCALIDPHGDLYSEILGLIPAERVEDVVLLDPADTEYPVGLNLLEITSIEERYFVVREMQAIMRRLVEDQYGYASKEWAGPVFFQHMQMNMLLAMSDTTHPGTLLEYYQIYQSKDYWKRWIPLRVTDAQLQRWVDSSLAGGDYTFKSKTENSTLGDYYSSKFTDFIFDPRLRNIFGQPKSTINISQIMNEGKILLVNLAKGLLGESNSRFLGLILMAKIQAEAMKRAKIHPSKRKPFYLYVDEFQNLATENFTVLLSEARKFGLGLILANQFISQIKDERIIQSVFGNVGTFMSFRLGREDAKLVEPQFLPYFDQTDLSNLPNWQVAIKTNLGGKAISPFTLQTSLPPTLPDSNTIKMIVKRSREKYSVPKDAVEKIIAKSLSESILVEE